MLRTPGETVYPMPTMSIPDPRHLPPFDELLQYDAIRLFVERALISWSAFPFTPATAPFVAEICQQLDGIPLAIELAAVRVNALPVEKIAERLDYRFRVLTRGSRTALPRHQTLLALVDWSYDLLEEAERALLQRLSVFSGGWTLEAAEAICAVNPEGEPYSLDIHPMDMLDLLTRLVDKTLVQVPEVRGENTRYRLLETIRQYARQKLRAAGEEHLTSESHGRFFLNLVIEANLMLKSPEQKTWTARLRAEQDNIRAAYTWWLQTNPANAVQMAGLLGRYWDRQGFYTEGRETLAKALSVADTVPALFKIKALKWASGLAMRQSNFKKATTQAEEGLILARELDDRVNMAAFLNVLGLITSGEGNDRAARNYMEESVAVQRELGNPWGLAISLGNLSNITRAMGDAQKALEYMQECIKISHELGDMHLIASNLDGLAECYIDLDELETAKPHLEEALHIQKELGDQQGQAYSLSDMGIVAWLQKDYVLAQDFHEKSLVIRREIGDRNGEGYVLNLMGINALAREDYKKAQQYLKNALAILLPLGDQRNSINCVEELGHVALGLGDPVQAVKLWAAAHAWRERVGTPMPKMFRPFHEAHIVQACELLGEETFRAVWEKGSAMAFEQVVAYADELVDGPE
ncbi:MAG TPA: tetratricopeptide repeat protein [Anaerolineales bacterium]|nr:tetratricopeptide repeat protein [Anaerolineales bacterium]